MNWKIAAIVTVSLSFLICLGAAVYVGFQIFHTFPLAQARTQCNSRNLDMSIRGCSAILQSGSANDADRTYAHFQRGLSYERKGDFDHAIQDDSEVIRVSPRESMAYNNRGFAYQRKGDLDHAIGTTIMPFKLSRNLESHGSTEARHTASKGTIPTPSITSIESSSFSRRTPWP